MRRLVEQVFGRMPREFATPQRRVVRSADELVGMIDQHNGLTDVYVSAYAFAGDEASYSDVVINKAVFDFDDAWGSLVETSRWLRGRGAAHFVVFSGSDGSGHIYVLTEPTTHQQSLEYFQRDVVIEGVGLRECASCGNPTAIDPDKPISRHHCGYCNEYYTDAETRLSVDPNLVGDPSTMVRVPNTWHPDAERFCVPLYPEEVGHDPRPAYEAAQSQRDVGLGDIVMGDEPVDITQRKDTAEDKYNSYSEKRRMEGFESDAAAMEEFDAQVAPADVLEDVGCTCVLSIIGAAGGDPPGDADPGHDDRRVLITSLIERGYNPAEINGFLVEYLAEETARHSIDEEEQAIRLYRDSVKAPNAVTLKRMGLWRQDCPEHAKVAVDWGDRA